MTKTRPRITRTKLINDYGAQVYYARKAKEYGYIDDEYSTYNEALAELVQRAGIKETEKYQVIELKVLRPVISDLIEGRSPIFSGRLKHEIVLTPELCPELMNRPLYLFSPTLQMCGSDQQ